jgi:NADH-quinone oxidoreductase subunit F
VKWGFLPKQTEKPVYLCVNADESEPGTFKDREIMEDDPHQLLEGILISSFAIKCHLAYIYIRGEMELGYERLWTAVREAEGAGLLGKNIFGTGFDLEVVVHRGAGAYICGEEAGLIESRKCKRAYPRIAAVSRHARALRLPTIVNNVETLACAAHRGAARWFRRSPRRPRAEAVLRLRHVVKPGVYELPMGTPLRGSSTTTPAVSEGRTLKGSFPQYVHAEVFAGRDRRGDGHGLRQRRLVPGSAGVIVMDDSVCMVWALLMPSSSLSRVVRTVHAVPRRHRLDAHGGRRLEAARGASKTLTSLGVPAT